jgi:hypothetical protein
MDARKHAIDPLNYSSHSNLYNALQELLPANVRQSSWKCGNGDYIIITSPKEGEKGGVTPYKFSTQTGAALTKVADFGKQKSSNGGTVSKDGRFLILSQAKNQLGFFDLAQKGKRIAMLTERDFQQASGFTLLDGGGWNDIKPLFSVSENLDTLFLWEQDVFIAYSISHKKTLYRLTMPGSFDPNVMSILGMWNSNNFYLEDISPDGKKAFYASTTMAIVSDVGPSPMVHYTALINPELTAASFTSMEVVAAQLQYINHAIALAWNAETKKINDSRAKADAMFWEGYYKEQEKIQQARRSAYYNAQNSKSNLGVPVADAKKSLDAINGEDDEKTLRDMDKLQKQYNEKWGAYGH